MWKISTGNWDFEKRPFLTAIYNEELLCTTSIYWYTITLSLIAYWTANLSGINFYGEIFFLLLMKMWYYMDKYLLHKLIFPMNIAFWEFYMSEIVFGVATIIWILVLMLVVLCKLKEVASDEDINPSNLYYLVFLHYLSIAFGL